jgi:simple sugar transport system ATP-binding protein
MLIPSFTIAENVKINREDLQDRPLDRAAGKLFGSRLRRLDRKAINRDARKALDILGMSVEEYAMVEGLPVGYMQFVEIAREIDKTGIKALVLDEPTAVLAEAEAENLLKAVRSLADSGIGIIFISHRLDEVIKVADRVSILRDGELIVTKSAKDTNLLEMAELMVGRPVTIDREELDSHALSGAPILEIRNLRVNMPGERVEDIHLTVRKGEIFGIGGLAGQGKLGIANGLMGMYPAAGEAIFAGKPLPLNSPGGALRAGIAYLSEDRKGVGLLLDESIEMNIIFTAMQVHNRFLSAIGPFRLLSNAASREQAEKMIRELDIRCTSRQQKVGSLSGGNQQKVCVARALMQNPALLLVSEPTRGIDIGAKKLVLDLLYKLSRESGMTVVITSSELAELRSICDRIAIVYNGRVEGILAPDAPAKDFGLMMSGVGQEVS